MWRQTRDRRPSQGEAGGWSGYFSLDSTPGAVYDITEWIDRDCDPPIVRYAYQVRYCSAPHDGLTWQYRLDLHPLDNGLVFVSHFHDQAVTDDEHGPRPMAARLTLAEALPLLESRALGSLGPCADRPPGRRGRAPYEPRGGALLVEPATRA